MAANRIVHRQQLAARALLLGTLCTLLGMSATELRSEEVDGAARIESFWQEIRSTRLVSERAVEVGGLRLRIASMAFFEIEQGVLFFATPVSGRTAELVFQGKARLILEPPDEIEAGQLELFTGNTSLDEKVSEAVMVLTDDATMEALAARPEAPEADPKLRTRAEELFRQWLTRPERRLLGVESALFRDAVGDPFYAGYFAGYFRGEELGELVCLFEPDAPEPGNSPGSTPQKRRCASSCASSAASRARAV